MKRQASTCLILLMVTACVRDYTGQISALEQALASDTPLVLLKQTHPDYSDQIGDLDRLKDDLEWLKYTFERRSVQFAETQEDKTRSNGISHFVSGQAEVVLEGDPGWKYQGPVQFEFVQGVTPKIRSGILTDLRDIRSLMQKRRAAIEENNVLAYDELIHPNYENGDENKTELKTRIKGQITGQKIRLEPQYYTLEVRESLAHLTEWLLVKPQNITEANSSTRSPENQVKTEFTLKKSAGYWRISNLNGRF